MVTGAHLRALKLAVAAGKVQGGAPLLILLVRVGASRQKFSQLFLIACASHKDGRPAHSRRLINAHYCATRSACRCDVNDKTYSAAFATAQHLLQKPAHTEQGQSRSENLEKQASSELQNHRTAGARKCCLTGLHARKMPSRQCARTCAGCRVYVGLLLLLLLPGRSLSLARFSPTAQLVCREGAAHGSPQLLQHLRVVPVPVSKSNALYCTEHLRCVQNSWYRKRVTLTSLGRLL